MANRAINPGRECSGTRHVHTYTRACVRVSDPKYLDAREMAREEKDDEKCVWR